MTHPWAVLGGLALIAVVFVLAPVMGGVYLRLRGKRWVRCPETDLPAAVGPDAGYAALTAAFGEARVRVKSCTLWPRRAGCAQRCRDSAELSQEVQSPGETVLR